MAPLRRSLSAVPWGPVLGAFLLARLVVVVAGLLGQALAEHPVGPLGWDARWYLLIAADGYAGLPAEGRRFFPLWPLLARLAGVPFGDRPEVGLLVLANLAAVGSAIAAVLLTRELGGDPEGVEAAARRVPWVVAFAPAGFVLVTGYTEALFGILTCAVLVAARRSRWPVVVAAGLLAGLLRPTAVLLTVPVAIEVWRARPPGQRVPGSAALTAVLAPAIGLAGYLLWTGLRFGDAFSPLTVQTSSALRGGVAANPLGTAAGAVGSLLTDPLGDPGAGVHLPAMVLSIVLLVAGARRLPVAWTAFSAVVLTSALTAQHFSSFERYAASAVPLLVTAAFLLHTRARRWVALPVAAAALFAYTLAAYAGVYTP